MTFFDELTLVQENAEIRRKTTEEKSQELLWSIKNNLEIILNSRQGCSACAPEFGLKDFNDSTASSQSLCMEIISDIKRNIETFEPRVKVSRIDYLKDDYKQLSLTFRVLCSVSFTNQSELSEFDLVLNSATQQFSIL